MYINVMCRGGGGGSLLLFMRPAAEGNKLFLWREVLVLMERSLLPEPYDWPVKEETIF